MSCRLFATSVLSAVVLLVTANLPAEPGVRSTRFTVEGIGCGESEKEVISKGSFLQKHLKNRLGEGIYYSSVELLGLSEDVRICYETSTPPVGFEKAWLDHDAREGGRLFPLLPRMYSPNYRVVGVCSKQLEYNGAVVLRVGDSIDRIADFPGMPNPLIESSVLKPQAPRHLGREDYLRSSLTLLAPEYDKGDYSLWRWKVDELVVDVYVDKLTATVDWIGIWRPTDSSSAQQLTSPQSVGLGPSLVPAEGRPPTPIGKKI